MSILAGHLQFVNAQIAFQKKQAQRFSDNPKRQALHLNSMNRFIELAEALAQADSQMNRASIDPPKPVQLSLALTPSDLEGLPDELVSELSVSDADKTEFLITGLVDEAGGIISLDKLLIGLYKKTGEVMKRSALTSKIYRMTSKGMLWNVPGRKGFYSLKEMTEEETAVLFGSLN